MTLGRNEILARLRLARSEGIGPVTFRRLIERYGSAVRAAEMVPELSRRGGRVRPLNLCPLEKAEDEMERIALMGATLLVYGDTGYPARLAAIEDAPMTLTVRGDASLLNKAGIGVVGSRNASLQGRRFAETLSTELGRAGLVVTSGLARGIDTAAHTVTLATGTIAVVAGGVDVVYPQENRALYDQLAQRGAIVAENPLGMQPTSQHFPRRNRIISGLSMGVLVVEGTLKSGSLITAHMAADQGREVYAVPGHPLDPRAGGPNALIRDGATLVSSANDILDSLARLRELRVVRETPSLPTDFAFPEPESTALDDARNLLYPLLATVPVGVDDLIRETRLPTPIVQTVLLEWELGGRLTRHPGNRVSLGPEKPVSDPYIEYEMDKTGSLL